MKPELRGMSAVLDVSDPLPQTLATSSSRAEHADLQYRSGSGR